MIWKIAYNYNDIYTNVPYFFRRILIRESRPTSYEVQTTNKTILWTTMWNEKELNDKWNKAWTEINCKNENSQKNNYDQHNANPEISAGGMSLLLMTYSYWLTLTNTQRMKQTVEKLTNMTCAFHLSSTSTNLCGNFKTDRKDMLT